MDDDIKDAHPDILRALDEILRDALMNRGSLEDVEEAKKLVDAAEPGEWRVRDGRVVRHDGTPVESAESLVLMSKARTMVPRLVRIVFALRNALANQIAVAMNARAEMKRDKETLARHREEVARSAGTGPEDEISLIEMHVRGRIFDDLVRSMKRHDPLGVPPAGSDGRIGADPSFEYLRRWAAGHSVRAEIYEDAFAAHRREAEWREEAFARNKKLNEETDEFRRLLAELRAGRIPPELEEKKGKKR